MAYGSKRVVWIGVKERILHTKDINAVKEVYFVYIERIVGVVHKSWKVCKNEQKMNRMLILIMKDDGVILK